MKTVIFDFDGTLVDTIPLCIEAFKKTLKKYLNKDFSTQEITSYFGPNETGILKTLLDDKWESALNDYLEYYESLHTSELKTVPGIVELLDYLKENKTRLAIVSGKGSESMAISLKHLGIESYFEHVMTGSEHGAEKELHLKTLLESMGIDSTEAVYVGDTAYDMEVANSLGMVSLGAAWTERARILDIMNESPDAVFTKTFLMQNWLVQRFEEMKMNIRKQRITFLMLIFIVIATFLFVYIK